MNNKLSVEILSSDKLILKEEDVNEIVVPTTMGDVGILPNHMGLISHIKPGEIVIKKNNRDDLLAITGGFLEVRKNRVSILADYAIRAEDIEVRRAEEAKERAKKVMENLTDREEFAKAEADLLRALLELKVATRRKTRETKLV
jgi:F-type H+-transporting ATPase subunit epsilon